MVLHFWLIPVLALLAAGIVGFYFTLKFTGGSGVRTEGRTLVHKPDDEDETPSRDGGRSVSGQFSVGSGNADGP